MWPKNEYVPETPGQYLERRKRELRREMARRRAQFRAAAQQYRKLAAA
jgi:hypothetical protein